MTKGNVMVEAQKDVKNNNNTVDIIKKLKEIENKIYSNVIKGEAVKYDDYENLRTYLKKLEELVSTKTEYAHNFIYNYFKLDKIPGIVIIPPSISGAYKNLNLTFSTNETQEVLRGKKENYLIEDAYRTKILKMIYNLNSSQQSLLNTILNEQGIIPSYVQIPKSKYLKEYNTVEKHYGYDVKNFIMLLNEFNGNLNKKILEKEKET